jgi:hypothetical protein
VSHAPASTPSFALTQPAAVSPVPKLTAHGADEPKHEIVTMEDLGIERVRISADF